MTKKEFKELESVHNYGRKPSGFTAIFFEWKSNDEGHGFKYCIFARKCNAKTDELRKLLNDFIEGRIEDVPWHIQLVVAQTDKQRFKVPLDSGGLNRLLKYEFVNPKYEFVK